MMERACVRRPSTRQGGDGVDFVAVVDQVIALLRQRGRVAYRTLKRQFQLDDDGAGGPQGRTSSMRQRCATMRQGRCSSGRVTPDLARACSARRTRTGPPRLHATLSRGEDSHLPQCPGRRAQAGHRAVCRSQGLHGTAGRPRPRGGPPAPRSRAGTDDGRGASLRGHGQSGHGRWHHGAVWGAPGP